MPDDAVRRNPVPGQDVAAQSLEGGHLGFGKGAIAPFVAGIDDFDADRAAVEVLLTLPARNPGMEGAALLRDEPPDRAVFLDDVMRADPRFGIAQPIDRLGGARHAG